MAAILRICISGFRIPSISVSDFTALKVKGEITFSNQYLFSGIGISIFSSQGRLEMGLIVDKVIISDLDQTQRFLDRIVHHIDRMHHALDEL